MKIKAQRFALGALIFVGFIFMLSVVIIQEDFFSLDSDKVLSYKPSSDLFRNDHETDGLAPATAVPILMYHGITVNVDDIGDNTTRENFINQMEMLKRNGYQTISIKEYQDFRQGITTLPPKPIIITFDDGRKDSYYPVDEVLEKLGFKATLFVATVRANNNDPFYLSWDELKKVQMTGRWEIEAHGRHSHDSVSIDDKNTQGRYLASRKFSESNSLESVADFENRVRQDYIDGVSDLKTHLNIDAKYYAIPMSDYGLTESNYEESYEYNKKLTAEYFDLAFVQSLTANNIALDTFYNYVDTEPQSLKRLEVKNMTDDDLEIALQNYAPTLPSLSFKLDNSNDSETLTKNLHKEFGNFEITADSLILTTNNTETASQIAVGDKGWKNYVFTANIAKNDAREGWANIYYSDEYNFIKLYWNESKIGLFEKIKGVDTVIAEKAIPSINNKDFTVVLSVKGDALDASIDTYSLAKNYPVKLKRGGAALGMWDPDGGVMSISSFAVVNLE